MLRLPKFAQISKVKFIQNLLKYQKSGLYKICPNIKSQVYTTVTAAEANPPALVVNPSAIGNLGSLALATGSDDLWIAWAVEPMIAFSQTTPSLVGFVIVKLHWEIQKISQRNPTSCTEKSNKDKEKMSRRADHSFLPDSAFFGGLRHRQSLSLDVFLIITPGYWIEATRYLWVNAWADTFRLWCIDEHSKHNYHQYFYCNAIFLLSLYCCLSSLVGVSKITAETLCEEFETSGCC